MYYTFNSYQCRLSNHPLVVEQMPHCHMSHVTSQSHYLVVYNSALCLYNKKLLDLQPPPSPQLVSYYQYYYTTTGELDTSISLCNAGIAPTSGSPLTSIGGGDGWTWLGMILGVAGSSCETWNTGCTACIKLGRQIVNESKPTCMMMGYGPRFFSESFLDGRIEWKYLALTKTWSPTLKSGKYDHFVSVGPW